MSEKPFEIPQNLRDVSGQNLKQAHAAYEQLTDFVTKAVGVWMGAMPSNPMTAGFKDVQDRAMQIAKENAELAFTFAGKISNVRTFQDIVTLQMQFAQDQMKAFATQTQQLFSVIPRSYPEVRTRATSMDAMPANPMTAGFKDVQDRAVQIAMENAEFSFRVRRQDLRRTDLRRHSDASDTVCSRADAGPRHADAATLQRDRRSYPEVGTRRHGAPDGRKALKSHGRWLQGCTRPCRGNGEEECRLKLSRWSKRSPRHRISRRL